MKKGLLALGLAALTLVGPSTAKADFSLQALINGTYSGPTLTGHDVFYHGLDFVFGPASYIATGNGSPPASAINVTPVTVGGIDSLSFNSGWLYSTVINGGAGFNDTSISYTVNVLSGPAITDLHLNVNGGVVGSGTYVVTDSFPGAGLPTLIVANSSPSSDDSIILAHPVTTLEVSKDILLAAGGVDNPGLAAISVILQGYSRTVPEPASMALLCMGGVGAVGMMRRRKVQA
jgi:hypothetical protein